MAGHSQDLGRSFDQVVAVNQEAERIDSGPDARPKIVIDPGGRIIVAYAVFQDDRYNGRVMFSRSVDGGASFSRPRPITDDATSQRFETLALDPGGEPVRRLDRQAQCRRRQGRRQTLCGRGIGLFLVVRWRGGLCHRRALLSTMFANAAVSGWPLPARADR